MRSGGSRPGRCLLLRGRRRVGKSRLVEVFAERSGVPSMYFTASGAAPALELSEFQREVLASDLPGRELFEGVALQSWDAALRLLASALPQDRPSVVVLDELPYLAASDPGFEGMLQRVWDRVLARRRVLLLLVGSDLSMMAALNEYGRPFHQRATPMVAVLSSARGSARSTAAEATGCWPASSRAGAVGAGVLSSRWCARRCGG